MFSSSLIHSKLLLVREQRGGGLCAYWRFCLSLIGRTYLITFITHHPASHPVPLPPSMLSNQVLKQIYSSRFNCTGDIIYHIVCSEVRT